MEGSSSSGLLDDEVLKDLNAIRSDLDPEILADLAAVDLESGSDQDEASDTDREGLGQLGSLEELLAAAEATHGAEAGKPFGELQSQLENLDEKRALSAADTAREEERRRQQQQEAAELRRALDAEGRRAQAEADALRSTIQAQLAELEAARAASLAAERAVADAMRGDRRSASGAAASDSVVVSIAELSDGSVLLSISEARPSRPPPAASGQLTGQRQRGAGAAGGGQAAKSTGQQVVDLD